MVYRLRLILWNALIWSWKRDGDTWNCWIQTHWRTINGRDSLFFHVNTRPTHMWKFLQRKRWRTDFLKIFDSRCFNSLYICAHSCMQRRHIEEQSRALPEMYLFSMGQFLCVVMTMIDCKQTRKTDLPSAIYMCLCEVEETALDLLYTSFIAKL